MATAALGMAIVFVDDYIGAKSWYEKVLGLEPRVVVDEGQWATYGFPEGDALIAIHGGVPVNRAGRGPGAPPVVIALRCTEIESVVGDLRARGAVFHKDLRLIQEKVKAADVLDPEGNLIQLYEGEL